MSLFLYFRLEMNYIHSIFFLFSIALSGQNNPNIDTAFLSKTEIKADHITAVDDFKNTFYIKNNVFTKRSESKLLKYSNLRLSNITSANTFNPLKINLFYKAFNTVVILDNRLTEIFKIDFNQTKTYKNITHVSTGSDNTLWLFNQDTQQLELYNYKTNNTITKTLPITETVLQITSNYNHCWLLTKNHIYKYNYTGSLLSKIANNGFTSIQESNRNLFLQKDNTLYFKHNNTQETQSILIPNLLIHQFFVTNQIVYIYTGQDLYQYQLNLK